MRVSTRLVLAALVPALIALVVLGGLSAANDALVRLHGEHLAVAELRTDLEQSSGLVRSYVTQHDDRSREQFLMKHDEMVRDVKYASAIARPEDREQLRMMADDIATTRLLFLEIVDTHAREAVEGAAPSREAEARLVSRLSILSSDSGDRAAQLTRSIIDAALATEQRLFALVAGIVLLTALALTVALLLLRRSVTASLRRIEGGTAALATGDLGYRIGLHTHDELGDLSRSFDQMSSRLNEVTVSKAELEAEVRERERAEDELRERYDRERESARLGTTLAAIDHSIHSSRQVGEVVEGALAKAAEAIGASSVSVAGTVEGGSVIWYDWGFTPPVTGARFTDVVNPHGVAAIESGEVAAVEDTFTDPRVDNETMKAYGIRSVIVAPLIVRGLGIGTLYLNYQSGIHRFTDNEIDFVRKVASSLTLAIENARLFEAEREAQRQAKRELETTRLLLETADTLATLTALDDVLAEIVDRLLAVVGHKRAAISLWDEGRQEFLAAAAKGGPWVPLGLVTPWEAASSATREVVTSRETRVVEFDEVPEAERGAAPAHAVLRMLMVPIVFRGRVLGIASLDDPDERGEFTDRDLALVEGIAAQAAIAMENTRLFAAEQERRGRIEALHGVMEVAVSSLDAHESAQRILDFLAEQHGFELANVWLAHGDALELQAATGYPESYEARFSPMPLSRPYDAPRVYSSGRPIVVEDAAAANPAVREMYASMDVALGSYVIVPLASRGTTVGTLHFGWREQRRVTGEDLDFYASLGHELGVVLENATLYEAEHDIADRLQEALLSMPSELPGVEFAHSYHSATEAARVGGDFYDIFELGPDRLGVTIGDVAGKGIDAAVLTSLAKNTIRAHANEKGKTPSQILALTNDVVYKSTPTESFVTVFFGVLDRRDGWMAYANGGHTTAGVVCRDGTIGRLEVTGPLLGAFGNVEFEQAQVHLGTDDLLFLYTDGLTEARRGGEQYGEQRLLESLSLERDASPRELVAKVVEDVVSYTGNRLHDDLAILALRLVEQGGGAVSRRAGR